MVKMYIISCGSMFLSDANISWLIFILQQMIKIKIAAVSSPAPAQWKQAGELVDE